MKTIAEIIESKKDVTYTSASSPALDLCREMAKQGKFEEVALILSAWVAYAPQCEAFVRASLPAIILNSFIAEQDILTTCEFMDWTKDVPEWANDLADAALDEVALPNTVDGFLNSMRSRVPGKNAV